MWWRMPQTSATSVPGRKRTYSSACAAVRVKRGSQTISFDLFFSLALQDVLHGDRMRLGRIGAEQDHRLRIVHVVVGIGHRAVAPRVRDARDRRGVADARLVVAVVGAPERVELAEQVGLLVAELGRAEPVDEVRARLLADLQHLVADFVDRLFPLDAVSIGRRRASSGISGGARYAHARAPRRPWRSASP